MQNLDTLFERLQKSDFRSKFNLGPMEQQYLQKKGLSVILSHGRDFIRQRLATANPRNDGKQTPMRNHPVFIAQHGTATCCRGCLEKWHHIPKGRALTAAEQEYIMQIIERWIREHSSEWRFQ